ncbi:MAG: peptidoglycan-associated lipoprotein Pal [Thermodesulfobacteriota bacterium]
MVKKINIRFILFCILVISLAAAVSCAKTGPDPDGDEIRDEEISETEDERSERQRRAEEGSGIDEQELDDEERAAAEEQRKEEEEKEKEDVLSEKIYFEFDDSSLTREARDVLQRKVEWLRDNPDECIVIEGHCDERGTDEYNLALGSRRAESVKDYLVKAGVDGDQLSTISYGEERPAEEGSGEEVWEKNRRAEFRFCRD